MVTSSPAPPSRLRRAGRLAAGLAAFVLLALGAWQYRAWVLDRTHFEVSEVQHAADARSPGPAPLPDERMPFDMDATLDYGAARRVELGEVEAWLSVASSAEDPGAVFGRILRRQEASRQGRPGILDLLVTDDIAQTILRSQSQVGRMGDVAFLLRLPVDLEAGAEGRLALEPGALTLVYPVGDRFDYLLYYFPRGVDLRHLAGDAERAREILAPLGESFGRTMRPEMALALPRPGGGAGATATVICRPEGDAQDALAVATTRLRRDGWAFEASDPERGTFVASRRGTQVWMSARDGREQQGWVCVLIASARP